MSVCVPCSQSKLIPKCLTALIIGTISSINTDVYIYIHNITTGDLKRFDATSDGAGLVTLSGLDTEPDFMPDHAYELWITLKSAVSIETRETITVIDIDVTCVSLNFINVSGEAYASITLCLEDEAAAADDDGTCKCKKAEVTKIANYTLTDDDHVVYADATAGVIVQKLPVIPEPLKEYEIIKIDASGNKVTVDGNGNTINGTGTKDILSQYDVMRLRWDITAGDWYVM